MSFCVNWSLWKERRKARIRCARNVSEAMPEKGKKKKIKRRRREEKPSDHNAGLTSVKEAGKEGGLD